jgi:phospholipid/cholesterol/gamma-HCH transport system substrate-binding protein
VSKAAAATVKVGLLALLSVGSALGIILWLQGRTLNQGKPFSVQFADVDGLAEGAAVQLMGIRVGLVKSIDPVRLQNGNYTVKVDFAIVRDDVDIPKGSHLSIQQSGLVGEKFLEVTPPQTTQAVITLPKPNSTLPATFPLVLVHHGNEIPVGRVFKTQASEHPPYQTIRCWYQINTPGVILPSQYNVHLALGTTANPQPRLRIELGDGPLLAQPNPKAFFTIENPMRLKRFLEVQLESAEALKTTNNKINQLMSDETIMTLRSTVRNTEKLTAQAGKVVSQAEILFQKTAVDLDKLVASGQNLSVQITQVSSAVHKIIGNPAVQQDVTQTVAALQSSSAALSQLLNDPRLKQTMASTHQASQDAAASLHLVNTTLTQLNLPERLDTNLNDLNLTLKHLDELATSLNGLNNEERERIKQIVADTQGSAAQLKQFSKKLGGHFTLFKLLF